MLRGWAGDGEDEADLIDLSDKELIAAADEGLKEEIILRTLVLSHVMWEIVEMEVKIGPGTVHQQKNKISI